MTKKTKNIEELFQDAANSYQNPGEGNWENVLAATGKKMFFIFNLRAFNIYYLTAGILTIIIILLLLLNNKMGEKKSQDKKTQREVLPVIDSSKNDTQDTIYEINATIEEPVRSKLEEKDQTNKKAKEVEKSKTGTEKEDGFGKVEEKTTASEADSVAKTVLTPKLKEVETVKKETTIVKKPDTVVIKNKIRKFKKKRVRVK